MGPLLLIQGGEDPVVSAAAVDDYVAKLKAAGAPDVTYLRIDKGNHGVAYEHYMEPAMKAITEFFARVLKP
jgi:alpha-beta hydrolase superfamily lysophospholipase